MVTVTPYNVKQRAEDRLQILNLLATDKAVTQGILGKLAPGHHDAEQVLEAIDDIALRVQRLPAPDLADTLESLPRKSATPSGGWWAMKSAATCCLRPRITSGTISLTR